MSSLFSGGGAPGTPWLRLGRLEVGTTMLVTLTVVASWLAWVILPQLPELLFLNTEALAGGQLWRALSWPWANSLGLWPVLNLFMFWYFGTDLEAGIGRDRMAWLLLGIWGSLTTSAILIGLVLSGQALAGIGLVQFVVLLVWIAENPHRRFIFGIPAWVLGVVLLAIQLLGMLASRDMGGLLSLVLSLAGVAVVSRRVGLLTAYPWLPGGRAAGRPRTSRVSTRRSGPAPARTSRKDRRRVGDAERLDELLDLISAHGIDSLTPEQRRELMKLRDRLRRG